MTHYEFDRDPTNTCGVSGINVHVRGRPAQEMTKRRVSDSDLPSDI